MSVASSSLSSLSRADFLIRGRYVVAKNGTVIDAQTRLMWRRMPLKKRLTHQQALDAVRRFNADGGFAGYRDWRMPKKDELASLVVEGQRPAICHEAFPRTPLSWFWTSSCCEQNDRFAWDIDFYDGTIGVNVRNDLCHGHVFLVRS